MENLFFAISTICAKLTMPLTIMVCIIFILRIVGKKLSKECWVNKWNRWLRKKHIPLGISLVLTALLHGMFSSTGIFSLTWGALSLIILIGICLTFLFRKKLKTGWMHWHKVLTVAFLLTLVLHFIEIPALKEENPSTFEKNTTTSQIN